MRRELQRILVVRTDRMGDLLLTLPAVTAIRRKFPGAFLAMLVHSSMRELAEHCPDLDAVITDGPGDSGWRRFPSFVEKIRKERFDAALIMHPTFRLAAAMLLAGVRRRIGTAYRFYSFLFNRPIREHRKYASRHEAEFNLSLAADLGADISDPEFRLFIPDH
ncbi:glycosyltransferase family 9 protein, partial [bacterium]|nr:glycosyltransferase family 9 protein [bacterium]